MARKFIPESDSAFLAMARTFADRLAAQPSAYMLVPAEVAVVQQVVNEYQLAYFAANNRSTRTESVVNLKNQTRWSAVSVIRQYARLIRPNAGISDQSKIDLGINCRHGGLSRRDCPQSSPILKFMGAETGRHGLRYSDSNSPDSPAKPFGAIALQLFMAITPYGKAATRSPSHARYVGSYGRNPIVVAHQFQDAGRTATYFARWVGARNQHGPWSLPMTAQVMFSSSPVVEESDLKSAA